MMFRRHHHAGSNEEVSRAAKLSVDEVIDGRQLPHPPREVAPGAFLQPQRTLLHTSWSYVAFGAHHAVPAPAWRTPHCSYAYHWSGC